MKTNNFLHENGQVFIEPATDIQMQSGDTENVAGSYYVETLTAATPKHFYDILGASGANRLVVAVSAFAVVVAAAVAVVVA
jgi:hypothetical protein